MELMVAITIGLFITIGMTTFLANSLRSGSQLSAANRLNQEMRAIMTLMSRDLRRAGFWAVSENSVAAASDINPFDAVIISPSGDCILYSYDIDATNSAAPTNGTSGTTNELFGFKLNNEAVMVRIRGTNHNCASASDSVWETLTDTGLVKIETLTFTLDAPVDDLANPNRNVFYASGTSGPNIFRRTINITVKGCLKADTKVCQTITEKVRIENDLYRPS